MATIHSRRTGGLGASAIALVSTVAAGSTATAGADHTALTNKPVTFLGGATTATLTVTVVNDSLAELDETVNLDPRRRRGAGDRLAELRRAHDGERGRDRHRAVRPGGVRGDRRHASAPITVSRTGGAASGVTVWYRVIPADPGTATGQGVDREYTLTTGTPSFGADETTKTFAVTIVNDTIIEVDETVRLELFNPSTGLTIGAQDTTTLTIHDNDAPTFKFSAPTSRSSTTTPRARSSSAPAPTA
jgi:hypothetical protein